MYEGRTDMEPGRVPGHAPPDRDAAGQLLGEHAAIGGKPEVISVSAYVTPAPRAGLEVQGFTVVAK